MLNGFVGFQFAEDGTPISLWVSNKKKVHITQCFCGVRIYK